MIREDANPKWRHGARKVVQERAERDVLKDRIGLGERDKWAVYFDEDGKVRPDVVFTEAEQQRIAAEMKRARVDSDLHSWVAGMGLLQYLLAPLLLILSILLFLKSRRMELKSGGAVFGAIACVAMICMVYRGYFTSLGW
ncbi:MAG: hypothetical protein K8T91_13945 [Planctomycetes bacterium]|nr:hypothetical protein [Planctomycetota bacterium]